MQESMTPRRQKMASNRAVNKRQEVLRAGEDMEGDGDTKVAEGIGW